MAAGGRARAASYDDGMLPVIDLEHAVENGKITEKGREACALVAQCLHETGVLVVRDPRVSEGDNDEFVDMMERYFGQSREAKKPDEHPELHYQVGVTPDGVEVPFCAHDQECLSEIEKQPEQHRAHVPKGADPKWRFFWRLGERPEETQFAELNAPPVIPAAFKDKWATIMDKWGMKMLNAVDSVATLASVGFGWESDTLTTFMKQGPHLLAPTGSDLSEHNAVGTIFAGFHSDLNLFTIHGKSRYPGLYVWLRDGRKISVKVPEGCLLVQAGMQLERLTGGYVKAGMHEVVCTEATVKVLKDKMEKGESPWRVSSTVFGHVNSDQVLKPLGQFATLEANTQYPAIQAGTFVQKELERIALKAA